MTFNTTKTSTPCPICSDTKGKCRIVNKGSKGGLILCMAAAGEKKGTLVNGYKSIGDTKDGTWAKFIPDNSAEWNEERLFSWQQELKARNRQRALEEEHRLAASLSAIERSRQYTQLLSELSLSERDRLNLKSRGYTNSEIELSGIKSVEQWQKLKGEYSHLLPGIDITGKTLITQAGYLIPVRNVDGLIVGLQQRLRVITENSGRYRWLTSRTSKRPFGQSPHLYPSKFQTETRGELPLAIHRPSGKPVGIALTEGTGAKPFLTCQRLNQVVIGAAGGQWMGSEITWKYSLHQLSTELGGLKELTIYPDAGDVLNKSVMNRWIRVCTLLRQWGWKVSVAWWNQVTKEANDIDELSDYSLITYISPIEFIQISKTHRADGELTNSPGLEKDSKPNKIQELCQRGWDNWRRASRFTPQISLEQKHFHIEPPTPGTMLCIRSGLGTGKTHWLINTLLKKYDDLGFLSIGYRNSILLQFCAAAKDWYHLQQDLKGKEDEILIADVYSKIACCVDSLTHFDPEDFDGRVLILDEIESIVKHLLQANTAVSYFREKVKELFRDALNRASLIVCLDGHLTDGTVTYLQSLLTSPKKIVKVQNFYKGNRGIVEFYQGSESSNEIRVNDFSCVFEAIKNNPNRLAIAGDSQQQIEATDKLLQGLCRKTLRLDSTTINQKWVAEFLKNPAAYLMRHGIEVFLYSPSAEAGLNVDIQGYFTDLYFIFVGVISTDAQLQMMGRIRDKEALIHVCCQQRGLPSPSISKASIPERLQQEILTYAIDCVEVSLSGVGGDDLIANTARQQVQFSADRHFVQEVKLIALENHEKANLRDCLREALVSSGYQVNGVTGQKFDNRKLKDKKAEVLGQRAEAIHASADISTSEAFDKSRNFGATIEDKYAVTKRRLLDRLPGIETATYTISVGTEVSPTARENLVAPNQTGTTEDETSTLQANLESLSQVKLAIADSDRAENQQVPQTKFEMPVFTPEFIKKVLFDDRALISKIELYWLLMHPEAAKLLQQERWHKKLTIFTDPEPNCAKRINLTTYHSRWLKIQRLAEMGIMAFLLEGATWTGDASEVIEFWEKGKGAKYQRAVQIKVGNSTPGEYLGRVLRALGLETQSNLITRPDRKKVRVYRLVPVVREKLAIYEAVGRRYEEYLAAVKVSLDWGAIRSAIESISTEVSGVQILIGQNVEGGSPSRNLLINNPEGDRLLKQKAETKTELEVLVEQLKVATSGEVQALAIDSHRWENALLFLSHKRRQQLQQWLPDLMPENQQASKPIQLDDGKPIEPPSAEPLTPSPYIYSQQRDDVSSQAQSQQASKSIQSDDGKPIEPPSAEPLTPSPYIYSQQRDDVSSQTQSQQASKPIQLDDEKPIEPPSAFSLTPSPYIYSQQRDDVSSQTQSQQASKPIPLKETSQEHLSWLRQFLADLEAPPFLRKVRFTSEFDIYREFSEAEARSMGIDAQSCICPDYWERVVRALDLTFQMVAAFAVEGESPPFDVVEGESPPFDVVEGISKTADPVEDISKAADTVEDCAKRLNSCQSIEAFEILQDFRRATM